MLDVKEGTEQHPGHFQPKQCYIPYSETLRNSVKYSKNPANHPFKLILPQQVKGEVDMCDPVVFVCSGTAVSLEPSTTSAWAGYPAYPWSGTRSTRPGGKLFCCSTPSPTRWAYASRGHTSHMGTITMLTCCTHEIDFECNVV